MRRYSFETRVDVPPAQLYAAIANVQRWPEWDPELHRIVLDGAVTPGSVFWLTPKGGPRVKMTVEQAQPATLFSDLAHLPLATMRTRHAFEPSGAGTRLQVVIEVWGPLSFLWDRLVARKQGAGLSHQTAAFVRFAREQAVADRN